MKKCSIPKVIVLVLTLSALVSLSSAAILPMDYFVLSGFTFHGKTFFFSKPCETEDQFINQGTAFIGLNTRLTVTWWPKVKICHFRALDGVYGNLVQQETEYTVAMSGKPIDYIISDAKTLVVAEVLKESYGLIRHLYVHYKDVNQFTEGLNFEASIAKGIDLIADRPQMCVTFSVIQKTVKILSWSEQNILSWSYHSPFTTVFFGKQLKRKLTQLKPDYYAINDFYAANSGDPCLEGKEFKGKFQYFLLDRMRENFFGWLQQFTTQNQNPDFRIQICYNIIQNVNTQQFQKNQKDYIKTLTELRQIGFGLEYRPGVFIVRGLNTISSSVEENAKFDIVNSVEEGHTKGLAYIGNDQKKVACTVWQNDGKLKVFYRLWVDANTWSTNSAQMYEGSASECIFAAQNLQLYDNQTKQLYDYLGITGQGQAGNQGGAAGGAGGQSQDDKRQGAAGPCAILYTECNYQGQSTKVCEDTPYMPKDFKAKSVKVPKGWEVEIYLSNTYQGKKVVRTSDDPCIEQTEFHQI